MNTETDLLTEYEKKILGQREKVKDRYLELQKLFPLFTPWRYIKKISAEMSLTDVGVYKMVIDMGLYVPKKKKK